MQKRLKNSKDIAELRNKLLKEQNNLDPIIHEVITNPVVDHDHLKGNIRKVLGNSTNQFLGKVECSYIRFIKYQTTMPLAQVLENVAKYLKTDYSNNPLHPNSIKVELRPFKRLKVDAQIKVLEKLNLVPKSNLKSRVKQVRTLLLNGELDYNKLNSLCKEV